MDNCNELHKSIELNFDDKFKAHEIRIRKLEDTDILRSERLDNLIEKIDGLTNRINWLMMSIIVGLMSFFVWYIQSL